MDEVLARIGNDLLGRLSGPLTLRVFLQPLMATFFAVRDGLADARHGRPPFMRTIVGNREERRRLIREGFTAIIKLVIMAILLDLVYQAIVFRRIYPFEASTSRSSSPSCRTFSSAARSADLSGSGVEHDNT